MVILVQHICTFKKKRMATKINKVNVGIIGLGEHMKWSHVPFLEGDSRVQLVGYYDIKKTEDTEMKAFTSVEELLNDKSIDAVFIGTPDIEHSTLTLQAVQAGKHVFCEKPMACNERDFELLKQSLQLAKDKQLVVSSCHPRRFDPAVVYIKQLMKSLGPIKKFTFRFLYHKIEDGWKMDRCLMQDHFSHEIDLLIHLFGDTEIELMHAQKGPHRYHVIGENKSGLEFEFVGERILDETVYYEFMELDLEDGEKICFNMNNGLLLHGDTSYQVAKKDYEVMFKQTNKNFIDSVIGVADSYLTPENLLFNNQWFKEYRK